jgi:hypothetical protein
MNALSFANAAIGTVASSFDADDVTLSLTTGHGNRFPSGKFRVVLYNSSDYESMAEAFWAGEAEVIEATGKTSSSLTGLARGLEGTTPITATGGMTYKVVLGTTAVVLASLPQVGSLARFGAKGDGVSDDHDAIQDAIDCVAETEGGGKIWIPSGSFYSSEALDMHASTVNAYPIGKPLVIEGAAPTASEIWTDSADILMDYGDLTGKYGAQLTMRDMTLRTTKHDGKLMRFWSANPDNSRFWPRFTGCHFDYVGRSTFSGDKLTLTNVDAVCVLGASYTLENKANTGWGTTAVGDLIIFDSAYAGVHVLCRVTQLSYGADADVILVTVFGHSGSIAATGKQASVGGVLFALEFYGLLGGLFHGINILGGCGSGNYPWNFGLYAEYSSHCTYQSVWCASGRSAGGLWLRGGGHNHIYLSRVDSGSRVGTPLYVVEGESGDVLDGVYSEGHEETPGILIKDCWGTEMRGVAPAPLTLAPNGDAIFFQNSKGIRMTSGRIPDQLYYEGTGVGLYIDDDCDHISIEGTRIAGSVNNLRLPTAHYLDIKVRAITVMDYYKQPNGIYRDGRDAFGASDEVDYRQTVEDWSRSPVAKNLAAVILTRPTPSPGVASNIWVAPKAGSITQVWVRSNTARTAGTLTVEVYKGGVATGLQAVLDGSNTIFKLTSQATGLDTVAAGNQLDIRVTTDGSWEPTTAGIIAGLRVEATV